MTNALRRLEPQSFRDKFSLRNRFYGKPKPARKRVLQSLFNPQISASNGSWQDTTGVRDAHLSYTEGGCYQFGGVEYVEVSHHDDFSFVNTETGTDLPFSVWFNIKLDASTSAMGIISKDDGSNHEWYIKVESTNKIRVVLIDQDGSSSGQWIEAATVLSNSTWYQIEVGYDGRGGSDAADGLSVRIDGVESTVTAYNNSYTAMHNTTAKLNIGRYAGSNNLEGQLFDVRVYNRLLNDNDRAVLKQYRPNQNGCVAFWKMDERASTNVTAYDSSGNGHDGDILGSNPADFNATQTQHSFANALGHRQFNDMIYPRDESNPSQDVTGTALQHVGRIRYSGRFMSPCATFTSTTSAIWNAGVSDPNTLFGGRTFRAQFRSTSNAGDYRVLCSYGNSCYRIMFQGTDNELVVNETTISSVTIDLNTNYVIEVDYDSSGNGTEVRLTPEGGTTTTTSINAPAGDTSSKNNDTNVLKFYVSGRRKNTYVYVWLVGWVYVSSTFAYGWLGQIWDVSWSNYTHWPLQEGAGLVSFDAKSNKTLVHYSTDALTTIAKWTSRTTTLWTQKQHLYHGDLADGFSLYEWDSADATGTNLQYNFVSILLGILGNVLGLMSQVSPPLRVKFDDSGNAQTDLTLPDGYTKTSDHPAGSYLQVNATTLVDLNPHSIAELNNAGITAGTYIGHGQSDPSNVTVTRDLNNNITKIITSET